MKKKANAVKLNIIEKPVESLILIILGWSINLIFVPANPGWIIFLLLFVILFCLLQSLYNNKQTQNILNLHVNQVEKILGSTNEVIAEPNFHEILTSNYEGVCYERLITLVENAQQEIFVVPNPFRGGEISSWDKIEREKYLKKIEEKIQNKNNPRFRYTRIQQIPKKSKEILSQHFGKVATDHIERLLNIRSERIRLRYIEGDEISGFMVIDKSILIKFITGIDYKGNKVLVAITIQDNYISNTIQDFCERFCEILFDQSKSITNPNQSQETGC